jgi:hypothetical protein
MKSTRSIVPLALTLALTACSMAGEATDGSATYGDDDTTQASTTSTGGETSAAATSAGSTATTSSSTSSSTSAGDPCGDGDLDPGELCDGDQLGGQTCVGLGAPYIGGQLACAPSCAAYDVSGCDVDAAAPLVRLNEVLAKGASEGPYAGMGDLIEIVNIGGAAADLSGWRLSDEPLLPDDKTIVFAPRTFLGPGERLVITESTGLPFGVSSSNPETLTLLDAGGVAVDVVTFEGAAAAISYCRVPDGDGPWQSCLQTPGAANKPGEAPQPTCGDGVLDEGEPCDGDQLDDATCATLGFDGGQLACTDACTFDTNACTTASKLVLNELSSAGDDEIELYNAGPAAVDISGWILTDDLADPYDPELDAEELLFPPGTTLAPGAFLVLPKGVGALEHPFGLGAGGDSVRLFDAELTVVDAATYGQDQAAQSFCRLPDGPGGAWTPGCVATFGASNKGP